MPLKVCLHISAFPPGGAERQIVNLAHELAARDVKVILLHAQKDITRAYYLELLEGSGVEVVYAGTPAFLQEGIRLSRRHPDFYAHIPAPGTLKMGILYLAGALSHFRPDVLHTYLDIPNCTAGPAAVMAGIPHLASFRDVDPHTGGFVLPEGMVHVRPGSHGGHGPATRGLAELTLPLYRYLLDTASPRFEANSKNGACHYARWLNIAPEQITYTPNGIDPADYVTPCAMSPLETRKELGIPAGAPIILTLARFAPNKAPGTMLDIFAQIHAARPDARYIIAGMRMTENDEMGAMVRERGLGDAVHLLGARNDVASLLGCADVFLLSSRFEGFPNAIMEAMAAGVPVVSSNVGGVPDLVRHGRDGFLHGPEDTEGLAQSVLRLLSDGPMRKCFGASGRQRILDEFSLKKLGDRAISQYETLLGRDTSPPPRG